ncbi:hypothetical protein DFJ74DRAFT_646713 [Hyaloraphidium curvatum]|nr:hypothetical protein DFJ74DRAFT_646713 [Hyaloraphidium curvatum]
MDSPPSLSPLSLAAARPLPGDPALGTLGCLDYDVGLKCTLVLHASLADRSLVALSPQTLLHVLTFLRARCPRSLLRLARASRPLSLLAHDPTLWRTVALSLRLGMPAAAAGRLLRAVAGLANGQGRHGVRRFAMDAHAGDLWDPARAGEVLDCLGEAHAAWLEELAVGSSRRRWADLPSGALPGLLCTAGGMPNLRRAELAVSLPAAAASEALEALLRAAPNLVELVLDLDLDCEGVGGSPRSTASASASEDSDDEEPEAPSPDTARPFSLPTSPHPLRSLSLLGPPHADPVPLHPPSLALLFPSLDRLSLSDPFRVLPTGTDRREPELLLSLLASFPRLRSLRYPGIGRGELDALLSHRLPGPGELRFSVDEFSAHDAGWVRRWSARMRGALGRFWAANAGGGVGRIVFEMGEGGRGLVSTPGGLEEVEVEAGEGTRAWAL